MLTEKGSIETARISVESANDLYRKKLKLVSVIMLIVGTIGIVAYVTVGTVWDVKYNADPLWIKALLIFAVPFTLGLLGFITITRLHSRELKEAKTSKCEFFADCFFYNIQTASAIQPDSKTDKFVYPDAVLKRENEKYGYIYVLSQGAFLAFSKEDLTLPELNAIRKNFRKEVDGEVVPLEKFKEEDDTSESN